MKSKVFYSCTTTLLVSAIAMSLSPAYATSSASAAGNSASRSARASATAARPSSTGSNKVDSKGSKTEDGSVASNNVTQAQASSNQAPAAASSSSENNPTKLGVVTVTGQLAALRRAQATKRDAIGVVDSISAEEAGKFPDQNVADALQRVPGVSVNRANGQANNITVRGFGPSFVSVLLNGRTLATASTDRAFNFDTLASGIIEQAIVHKTSSADLPAGGIGGTVNIITAKPFDFKGFHASASVSGVNDSIGGGFSNKTTPKVSMIVGDSSSDHTFGWLASAVYYKRDHTEQQVDAQGWIPNLDYSQLNPAYTNISLPRSLAGQLEKQTRTRKTFNGAIEWEPFQNLSVNINTLYSEYQVDSKYNAFGQFSNTSDIKSLTADANGTALKYTRYDTGALSNDYITQSKPSDAHNEQTGAHVKYQFNSSTELDFDTSVSRAWDKQSKNAYFLVMGTRNIGVNPMWMNNGDNKLPSYSNILSTTDTSNLRVHCCSRGGQGPNVSDRVMENKLHFSKVFESGALARLDFGLENSNRKKTQVSWVTPNGLLCSEYCGYVASVPASAVNAHVFNAGSLVGGVSPGFPRQWITYDPNKYFAYLTTPAAYDQLPNPAAFKKLLDANGGTFAARPAPQTYSQIKERVKSAYAKAKFEGSIGDMPWTLDAGVRYTKTDTTSLANSLPLLAINVNPNDSSNAIPTYGSLSPITSKGSYSNWLPSADFKLNILENLIFRVAASKTLTRPDIGNLSAAESYNFRPSNQSKTTGNAGLKPYTSKNFDSGLEWYINDSSYISLDAFYKKVNNFVTLITSPVNILGFPFQETKPVNLNAATIKGAEFTFNYQFKRLPYPFNGLGVASNYTYVKSNASISPAAIVNAGKFAVPGIGDSANVSAYYEQGPVQVRLAYNWRDKYLSSIAGPQAQPTTVKSYAQLDFSSSYAINNHFSVYYDMTNLTDEKIYNYQVYLNRENYAEADGRTAYFGIRAKW